MDEPTTFGPERWARLDDLFHRAETLDPAARDAFLARQCPDDAEVQAEVKALLATGTTHSMNVVDAVERSLRRMTPGRGSTNGGIQMSMADMYTWYKALSGGPVLDEAMRSAVLKPYAQHPSGTVYAGYGWFIRMDDDGSLVQVSHTGSDGRFTAAFVWRPADRFFVYLVGLDQEEPALEAVRSVLRIAATSPPSH